jgi:hypothetical protein
MKKLHKNLLETAAATMLALGMTSTALAAPVFTVDPSGLGARQGPFQADFMTGFSSTLLNSTADGHTGEGWLQFTSFKLGSSFVLPPASGLGTDYGLFLTFRLTDVLSEGTLNAAGSTNTLTQLDYKMYFDPGTGDPTMLPGKTFNTFTDGNANSGTDPTYVDVGNNDILIAEGSLISGTSGFNNLGGAFLNTINNFILNTSGSDFFTAPVPFFNVTFSEFNNTTQGILRNGNLISINQASGGVDFNKIPEPASLALIGLGLFAMGAVRRRYS